MVVEARAWVGQKFLPPRSLHEADGSCTRPAWSVRCLAMKPTLDGRMLEVTMVLVAFDVTAAARRGAGARHWRLRHER